MRKTELKPKPKLNNFKSIESLLQEYNIKDQLEKEMSDYGSQRARSASVGGGRESINDAVSQGISVE